MKTLTTGATLLALSATTALSAGLDRSGQSVSAVFAAPGTTTLSYGIVLPEVTGRDIGTGGSYDSVGRDYTQTSISHTFGIGERATLALIIDQPYGADIDYGSDPTATRLGGTGADFNSIAISGVARYKVSDRFSVFGGVSAQRLDASVALNGFAYQQAIVLSGVADSVPGIDAQTVGAAVSCTPQAAAAGLSCSPFQGLAAGAIDAATGGNSATVIGTAAGGLAAFAATGGYNFDMEETTAPHYMIGAAYEIPDIALRISGTYHFETKHSADTTETLLGATTTGSVDFVTPQSFNLEAQTGIAAGTLLTASWRWTEFSAVDLVPDRLGSDLVNLDDSNRYTLGVARQFSDKFAGSVTFSYEPEGDDLVSPLGPTNGLKGISLGGRWTDGPLNISGGINYSILGDATPEVADVAQASFTDNHVIGLGLKIDMKF